MSSLEITTPLITFFTLSTSTDDHLIQIGIIFNNPGFTLLAITLCLFLWI